MRITYDEKANVVFLRVKDQKAETRTFIVPGVLANLDEEGNIISIEFLNASVQVDDPLHVDYVNYAEKSQTR
jgi:uncharacterized protein YuzE